MGDTSSDSRRDGRLKLLVGVGTSLLLDVPKKLLNVKKPESRLPDAEETDAMMR